jgi:CBS domain-containing protein
MVTDRDIVVRAVAEGRDPNTTKVADVMSPQVAYCFEDQRVEEAAQMMEARQIRRLPILDREKQLVGIVSLGDIAIGTRDEQLAGQVLEEVSAPSGVR